MIFNNTQRTLLQDPMVALKIGKFITFKKVVLVPARGYSTHKTVKRTPQILKMAPATKRLGCH